MIKIIIILQRQTKKRGVMEYLLFTVTEKMAEDSLCDGAKAEVFLSLSFIKLKNLQV